LADSRTVFDLFLINHRLNRLHDVYMELLKLSKNINLERGIPSWAGHWFNSLGSIFIVFTWSNYEKMLNKLNI